MTKRDGNGDLWRYQAKCNVKNGHVCERLTADGKPTGEMKHVPDWMWKAWETTNER